MDVGGREPSFTAGGYMKWSSLLGKQCKYFAKKLAINFHITQQFHFLASTPRTHKLFKKKKICGPTYLYCNTTHNNQNMETTQVSKER